MSPRHAARRLSRTTRSASTATAAIVALAGGLAQAQTTVECIAPSTNSTPGVWYESTVTGTGGAVGTVDLAGEGGDLENDQPLPTGAALLSTTTDNNDRANIGIFDDYGSPGDVFPTLSITYSYFKASNPGQNLFAAPSLKLAIFNSVCDDPASAGDCFGLLVYEPTWNQPGSEASSVAPPLDTWRTVTIDGDNGLFWWTGGFGQPNTAGGPPLRTLNEWLAVMSSDFADADIAQMEIGVGSFNQLQNGYVDNVQISHAFDAGYSNAYDFEAQGTPAPTVVECIAGPTNTAPSTWYASTVTGDGAVATVDLTGEGGDLESNQPLPTGAALLTTTNDNNDRANIGIADDFGTPTDLFSSLAVTYSYHKASNPGQNLFAAPSLKLAFFNAVCDDPASAGDCFGQLIYEPTWNQPGFEGSSVAVPLDTWQTVTIDGDNGLFWWTGGFGQPNTAGGPPLRTLNEWLAVFSSDFADSTLSQIEIGVGSFAPLQIGYVDNVQVSHCSDGGLNVLYDFEATPPATPTTVECIAPASNTDPGVWFASTVTGAGMVGTVDLTGEGGDLESNQPLPTGTALLTTTNDNNDRANIGIADDYGTPADLFSTLSIAYSYYKATNPGQNLFAAPSLKLAFFNSVCDDPASAGDCFGQLIYEPTWNQPGFEGSSVAVPLDTWQSVTIDGDNGLFWWTGGFGQPNTAGGPPLRTLNEWLAVFSSDFQDSTLSQIEIGVGSFAPLQIGYVDDVQISHCFDGGLNVAYDFESNPPMVSCPPDVTIGCTDSTDPSNTGSATGTGTITFSDSVDLTGCSGTGTITRTWTATDDCGNTDSCTQIITIADTNAPMITCPPDTTLEWVQGLVTSPNNPETGGFATATDDCDPMPAIAFSDSVTASGCPGNITITRTWTATDDCGNVASCDQTISIFDTTDPVVTCPPDITVECDPAGVDTSTAVTGTATASDDCDPALPDPGFTDVTTAGPCPNTFVIQRTWTVMDCSGNTGSCVQTITVADTTPPTITCPADVTIECDDPTDPASTGGEATGTDLCGAVTITFSDAFTAGACPAEGTIVRTWTATDECGNTATCDQTITVQDTAPPTITCPPDVTISCDESTIPGVLWSTLTEGGVAIYYNDNGMGENPANQAYLRAQYSQSNTNGAENQFDSAPLDGLGLLSWQGLYSGLPAGSTQFGLDMILPAPTADGSVTIPVLIAKDNVDSTPGGATGSDPVIWAVNDYKPGGASNPAAGITNSIVRGPTPPSASDVLITRNELSQSGTIFTVELEGVLTSDGIHHWFDPSTPHSPMSNFGLNGLFYFSGTLTYDSAGDPGTDLVDFYEGTITISANSPNTAIGVATAIDNCSLFPTIAFSDNVVPGACPNAFTIERTWTATDECGNSASCVQVITVDDTSPPEITCPPDVTVECGEPTDPVVAVLTDQGFETDTDGWDVFGGGFDAVRVPSGTSGITSASGDWHAEAMAGDTPAGTWGGYGFNPGCASTACAAADFPPGGYVTSVDVYMDVDGGWANDTRFDVDSAINQPDGSFRRDFIFNAGFYDDADGSPGSGTNRFIVSASNNSSPGSAFPKNPAKLPIAISTTGWYTFEHVFRDDGSGVLEVEMRILDSSGVLVNSWLLSDPTDVIGSTVGGNRYHWFTDQDFSPLAYDNMTLVVPQSATATDNCDPAPMITFMDDTSGLVGCNATGTIVRTWTATDACGNAASCDQLITVVDTTPPAITCPADVTVQCSDSTDPMDTGQASGTDTCGPVMIAFSDVADLTGCNGTGTITRTWTATDDCGNTASCDQVITVVDTLDPVITCPPDVTVQCSDSTGPMATGSATATDNCDAAPVITFTDAPSLGGCNGTGTITRTWTATDECGNTASCTQTITVVDTVDPVIACPADVTIECDASTDPMNTGSATATDNCDPAPAVTFADVVTPGACLAESTITRTWTATDDCGNSSSCMQTITVVDTTPPMVTCPPNVTVECDDSTDPMDTGSATATDNCDAAPVITFADTPSLGGCNGTGTITRIWTATDDCGNSSTCTQLITVVDTTDPVIACPADVTVECDDSSDPMDTGSATATDNCDAAPAITFADVVTPGACLAESTITRTWTATDDCGNTATCDQVITVVDTTDPVITCPADVTVECDDPTDPMSTGGEATATDNCDPAPVVTFADVVTPGACPAESTIVRTWTATDDCGNSSTCDQIITVEDSTAPVITCPPDVTVECDESMFAAVQTYLDAIGGLPAVPCPSGDSQPALSSLPANTPGLPYATLTGGIGVYYNAAGPEAPANQAYLRAQFSATNDNGALVNFSPMPLDGGGLFSWAALYGECPLFNPSCGSTIESQFGLDFVLPAPTADGSVVTPSLIAVDNVDSTPGGAAVVGPVTWAINDYKGASPNGPGNPATDPVNSLIRGESPPMPGDVQITRFDLVQSGTIFIAEVEGFLVSDGCHHWLTTTTPDSPLANFNLNRLFFFTGTLTYDSAGDDGTDRVDFYEGEITLTANSPLTDVGFATAVDNCSPFPVIAFTDVEMPGSCPQASTIERTWTATDECGNTSSCVQLISVVDTTPPTIACPPDVTIECSDSTLPAATGLGYLEDFESPSIGGPVIGGDFSSTGDDWNDFNSDLMQVPSGTGGISARSGSFYGLADSTSLPAPPDDFTGIFSRLGGYDSTFGNGFVVRQDVYMDLADPAVAADTYGWDLSAAVNNQAGSHRRDFIFHTASNAAGNILVGGSNNTNFTRRNDLASINNYEITASGWYTFEFVFRDAGDGSLAVDLNLRDDLGSLLWTETRNNPADVIATEIGGHRYLWFTFLEVDTLAIDDTLFADNPTATDNCDPAPMITFMDDTSGLVGCNATGTIVRTWTATDACGNAASCDQLITVVDTTPPAITCPADVTVQCSDSTDPMDTGQASGTDTCGPVMIAFSDVADLTGCNGTGTITRTWTATDDCGNAASCDQIITVIDTLPPSITCPPDVTVQCSDSTDPMDTGEPTGMDPCGPVTFTFADAASLGGCNGTGTITRTWTATDECGNTASCDQIITVVDTLGPVIDPPAMDLDVECDGAGNTADLMAWLADNGGAMASDPCGTVTWSNDFTALVPGCGGTASATVTFTATDECGNSSTTTATFSIVDTTPPVLSIPFGTKIEWGEPYDPSVTGMATAFDACGGDVTITFTDNVTMTNSCPTVALIGRTWTATDECGNSASGLQVIFAVDTTPPTVSCPPDTTIEWGDSEDPSNTGLPTGTDTCDDDLSFQFTDAVAETGTCPVVRIITRTWVAVDDCGNTSPPCTQTINVTDTTGPAITCPPDATYECDAVPGDLGSPTVVDNCDPDPVVTVDETTTGTAPNQVITRVFTATDECGNSSSCTQIVTIADTTPPVITCPESTTVECGDMSDAGEATAVDNCDANPAVTFEDMLVEGPCPGESVIFRTWTAVDGSGNASTCLQTITTTDMTPPVITCPPDADVEWTGTVITVPDPAETGEATATDTCAGSVTISFDDVGPLLSPSGDPCAPYLFERTWMAEDECGNISTCLQVISIVDTTPPVLTCPPDGTFECDAIPADLGDAEADDACDPNPTVTVEEVISQPAPPDQVAITEFMNNTAGDENALEWVELYNYGTTAADLSDWTLTDDSAAEFTFDAGTTLASGGFLIVAKNKAAFETEWLGGAPSADVYGDFSAALANSTDELTLTNGDGDVVWRLGYVNDEDSGAATFFAIDDFSFTDYGTELDPGVNRDGPDFNGLLGYESNAATADPAAYTTPGGDTGSPLLGSYSTFPAIASCPNEFTITRTFTAVDACGNESTCVQVIEAVDTTPPTITCPPDLALECDDADPGDFGMATAVDGCDPSPVITVEEITSGTPPNVMITRVFTATDACGNSASCEQVITIDDTTPPVIACPPDLTVPCDATDGFGDATATDNCDDSPTITVTGTETMGACPQESVLVRTFTAMDVRGNTSQCTQTITFVDTVKPVVTCPPNMTFDCGAVGPFGEATASDNCDPAPVIDVQEVVSAGGCPQEQTIVRIFTATDACGNKSNACIQTITIVDTTPPQLFCPENATVSCDDPSGPIATGPAVAIDDCDDEPLLISSDVLLPGDCPGETIINRTWTAEDACGNQSTCVQVITVTDTVPPVITCPPDATFECSDLGDSGTATAVDNCGGPVEITFADAVTTGSCPGETLTTRTWTATDTCGNSSTCVQTIVVVDTTPPVITCPPDETIECGLMGVGDTATAVDNCDDAVLVTFDDSVIDGDCPGTTVTSRTWTATDNCGNTASCVQTITVVDTTPPVITCPPDLTFECDAVGDFGAATAIDECGDATISVDEVTTIVACPQEQVIIRTHTATDGCGNSSSCVQTVTILDTTPPVITCPPDVSFPCDAPGDPGVATAVDNCDGEVLVTLVETSVPGDCPGETVITRVWTATDACGNGASCVQTVTLVDDEAPLVTGVIDVTYECDAIGVPPTPNVVDDCDPDPKLTFSDEVFPGECPGSTVTYRTYVGFDACGNQRSVVQTITVVDTTPPVISCPPDLAFSCTEMGDFGQPTAEDNCGGPVAITFMDTVSPGLCPQEQVISRTWTATDECGNASSCIQTVTVSDETPPVITCPPDMTFECTDVGDFGDATAVDDCDPAQVSVDEAVTIGSCPQEQVIVRVFTAIDACGNVAESCVQTITVVDSTPPMLTVPDDLTIECGAPTDPSATGMATATDACDGSVTVTFEDVAAAAGPCQVIGTITRTWTATDACGNTASADQVITLEDTTTPIVENCPDDITVDFGPGDCQSVVTWSPVTATDNCSGPSELWTEYSIDLGNDGVVNTSTFSPMFAFPAGTHRVITRVADACGNTNKECMFLVTVSISGPDCNANGVPDDCDIADGTSADCNADGVPDECEEDCNGNGVPDDCDVADGTSADCNANGVPDECEPDCNGNGLPDDCEYCPDCNDNGIQDCCEIAADPGLDADGNGILDECQGSCCEFGKPRVLTMLYTGDDCSATTTSQPPDKHGCEDFEPLPATVCIMATDDDDPFATNAKVWFSGVVSVGQTYDINALNEMESKLGTNTWVHVFDESCTTLLQTSFFHTSCSQPLFVGDQYGANLLVDCVGEDEPIPGDTCASGQPRVLYFQYTGDDCSATSHMQSGSSVSCSDFGTLEETVTILASNDSVPYEGTIWFQGTVAVGEAFAVNADDGSGNSELGSSTWIHVLDESGSFQLQSVKFHTSCSQPLIVGFQFGANLLIGFVGEDEPPVPASNDCDGDGMPDDVEIELIPAYDCNGNGTLDWCDIAGGVSEDCDANGVPDECDIAAGLLEDCNGNGIADVCDPDAPGGVFDGGPLGGDPADDCNGNGVWDACDISGGASEDANGNGIPDECETPVCLGDTNADGYVDVDDMVNVILDFGTDGTAHGGDVDDSTMVDVDDVVMVVVHWGTCP